MLILILIDVYYSHNAVFNFEKGSNCQNHSSLNSHNPVNSPHWGGENLTPHPTPSLTAIWKTLLCGVRNKAVFLILEHSSLRGVKQKKHEKKHEILAFKLLLHEIRLKNLTIRKIF